MLKTQMIIFFIGILVAYTVISSLINARKLRKSAKINTNRIMLHIRGRIKVEKLNGVKNPGFGYSNDRKDPYIYIYLEPGQNHLLLNYISKGASVLALAQASASGHGSFLKGIRREITFLAEENKQYQVEFNPKISEFIISAY